MTSIDSSQRGFTLVEVLVALAITGILSLVAVVGYQEYTSRARAADILVKYDAIRSGVGSVVANQTDGDCAALARRFGDANLNDAYASLGYDFTPATGGGFRPVLTVCAKADAGALGVKVARGAHDTLARTGSMEAGAMLSDTVVAFSLPLTAGNKATCTAYQAPPAGTACGGSASAKAGASTSPTASVTAPASGGQAPGQPVTAAPVTCGSNQVVGANGQCRDLVCRTEVVTPPTTTRVVVDSGLGDLLPPAQMLPPPAPSVPPRSAWRQGGLVAAGSECMLCGDKDRHEGCNELDLLLAMTNRCPDTQSVCQNTLEMYQGTPLQYRSCVDIQTAIRVSSNQQDCAEGTFMLKSNTEGATCSRTCYGNNCNIYDAGASMAGTTRTICE